MPKEIKVKNTIKDIKVIDKAANVGGHMKNAFIRSKQSAESTQEPEYHSPSEYAIEKTSGYAKDTTQEALSRTKNGINNPYKKVKQNIERGKSYFQEAKRQLPKERQRAAEQAKKAAERTKQTTEKLNVRSKEAEKSMQEAKKTVAEAKQTLQKTRQSGKQTLAETKRALKQAKSTGQQSIPAAKQSIKANNNVIKTAEQSIKASNHGVRTGNQAIKTTNQSIKTGNQIIKTNSRVIESGKKSIKAGKQTGKTIKTSAKAAKATSKSTIKTVKKSVKTAEKSAKAAVKTTKYTAKTAQKAAKASAKAAKVAAKSAKIAAKTAAQATKVAAKATIAMVKAAIAAIKGLVAIIAAGGWIAVLIILIICLVGAIVCSPKAIFFTNEGSAEEGGITIAMAIAEINSDYENEIERIKNENSYDYVEISGSRADWREILAVYAVYTVTDPDNAMDVATMTYEKVEILKNIFWSMNILTSSTGAIEVEEESVDDEGNTITETVSKTVLYITVNKKSYIEMSNDYGFDYEQTEELKELMLSEFNDMWNYLLYGSGSFDGIGDFTIVEVAASQLGNGGGIYWSWYGFSSRESWCACFVSWCAEQCGYINAGIIPRFALCSDGAAWFKNHGQWQNSGYIPKTGDIIFFDRDGSGVTHHVGIVERVEDGKVYTIEGNSSDLVKKRNYALDNSGIYGYGIPFYQ